MLLFVAAYAAFIAPKGMYPDLRLDGLSTLFYVANWHFILTGSNYFVATGPQSLLTPTWSLAIEEQFYLVWPLVVLGILYATRSLRVLLVVSALGAAASAVWMAFLYHPKGNLTRLYYGTDTHAQCLLVGATLSLSLVLVAERRRRAGTVPRLREGAHRLPGGDPAWVAATPLCRGVLAVVGGVGFAVSGLLWWRCTYTASFLWHGGFFVAAVATAAVLVCVVCAQRSWLAIALSVAPLRFLGRISYGMYLWHFPLYQWVDGARTGLSGYTLFAVRVALTVVVATASFFLVERPIRHGALFHAWRAWVVTPVAVFGVAAALVVATEAPTVAAARPTAPVAPAPAGPKIKVLLLGDSVALTLGLGLSEDVKPYNITEIDEGILGCGVTVGTQVKVLGMSDPTALACNSMPPPAGTPALEPTGSPDAERWTVWDTDWVDTVDPNVVMLLAGRWEVATRTYDGRWTNILDPTFADYVKRQLEYTVGLVSAKGAHVVLVTAPCFSSGEQARRIAVARGLARAARRAYNTLVREVAAEHPQTVSVLDLDAMVCPGGNYEPVIDGVQVRQADGVHFAITGGRVLAPKIWPSVAGCGSSAADRALLTRDRSAGDRL